MLSGTIEKCVRKGPIYIFVKKYNFIYIYTLNITIDIYSRTFLHRFSAISLTFYLYYANLYMMYILKISI